MRAPALISLLLLIAALSGCGKNPPPSAAPAEPKVKVSVESAAAEPPPPSPTPPDAPAAEPAGSTSTEAPPGTFAPPVEQAMGQLTMFVQQFYYEYKRVPKDVSELVKPAGYLPYIYAPPAGKKWAIDAAKKEVKLVNR